MDAVIIINPLDTDLFVTIVIHERVHDLPSVISNEEICLQSFLVITRKSRRNVFSLMLVVNELQTNDCVLVVIIIIPVSKGPSSLHG